ncbi:MAG: 2',3'-cyclic-nucleotide 2'-phosphodiesterase (5'-nucleotidase family) [Glaciecola sp.]|jgi:5'-nucleotidase/UDP-sugar diphosphatase
MTQFCTFFHFKQVAIFTLLTLLVSCQTSAFDDPNHGFESVKLTILYTNDEHGWMEGVEEGGGAASLFEQWQAQEGFTKDGPFLVLSGGDNWTGPAISTWVEGESMVEVMNAMDYDASAIGNHEFDFGLDTLAVRTSQANFPYLSANTAWKESGGYPLELGILPFTVKAVAGLNVAIIGLSTTETATTTMPSVVAPLVFNEYAQALRKVMPSVNQADPDLIIVISHVCMDELRVLAGEVADLNIAMMGAGHCNELVAEKIGDTLVLGGGYHFSSYAKAVIDYDVKSAAVISSSSTIHENSIGLEDNAVADIVDQWKSLSAETLAENLGFSARDWERSGEQLRQAIVNSWLEFDVTADVAITNAGGIRSSISAGEINLGTVVSMLPFNNTIIATQISGRVLRTVLEEGERPVFAGLTKVAGKWVVGRTGKALAQDGLYRVLINSFMYDGGDGFGMVAEFDPNGFDTQANYREPFVQWLRKLNTSPSNPLILD